MRSHLNLCGFFLILTLIPHFALADAALLLKGKVTGFDEHTYKITVGQTTYVIKKAALNPGQLADLKKKHSGDPVVLQVTTGAIETVQAKAVAKGIEKSKTGK